MMYLSCGDTKTLMEKTGGLFSFGKKKEPTVSNGALVSYLQGKKDSKDIGDWNFEQQWSMNFPVASTAVDWSDKLGLLVVGEDSGTMHFIKPDQSNTMKYEEQFFIKVHNDRIIKLFIDSDKKLVYSIGEDRKFKEVSIDKKRVNNEFEVSGKRPNCM